MALNLALPKLSLSLPDADALAFAGARFKAWWNGDPPPKLESLEGGGSGQGISASKLNISACEGLWGPERNYPSALELECQLASAAACKKDSVIVLVGCGTGAMAKALLDQFAVEVRNYEPIGTSRALCDKAMKKSKLKKRYKSIALDWQPGSFPEAGADAAIFMYQGGAPGRLEAAAFAALRMLKPGAVAVWFDLFAAEDDEGLAACRGVENRVFAPAEELLGPAAAAGLTVKSDENWDAQFLAAIASSWANAAADFDKRQAALIKSGGQAAAVLALKSVLTWQARAEAVRAGKLSARRIIIGP